MKHGLGKLVLSDGTLYYDGEWKHNSINGCGTMIFKNGKMYEGHWLNNQMNG